jgi:alanyl-tRNA synthetase
MDSNEIRKAFFDYFKSKGHEIVPSAPMVVKDDPTLMFINAGMNQFKDVFLGNKIAKNPRVANTQKCLRVSGKHNDLEEVGVDTYHHTMFEMLGNWSFGDYFKKEAIEWAWELLVDVYKIDKDRLYATYFGGDEADGLEADDEAKELWLNYLPEGHVLACDKKDNFWEMGDVGPCGPCSELHVDLRSDAQRKEKDGAEIVNQDDPLVIEIWNLVFMQFNRKWNSSSEQKQFLQEEKVNREKLTNSDFKKQRVISLSKHTNLVDLPAKHVDTGMGFERLCMVLQSKQSNYDSDVFSPLIEKMEDFSGLRYRPEDTGKQADIINIAMRVIVDHVRAISFSIADGQLPSNTGAGYVIRRILRRAVRYGYQSLNLKEPFLHRLVPVLANQLKEVFPEIQQQKSLIQKVVKEEETSFFRTLDQGLKRIDDICINLSSKGEKIIHGKEVFELYDTYGFPVDLTSLIARQYDLDIDKKEFEAELAKQKDRSRQATTLEVEDWVELKKDDVEEFIGYDKLETHVYITRYRKIKEKGKDKYQLVFNITPFYAESGGQVGDTGFIESNDEKVYIINTKKENNLIVHFAEKLPSNPEVKFSAVVNATKRISTNNNHSATHLLHEALREVLGTHVEQKGSLVNADHLRFDFSHFSKVEHDELAKVEALVNQRIRENHALEEQRAIPMEDAVEMGAMALFGEKYGDLVRVIKFGNSIELCGGTHVSATGKMGLFKITHEGAIAAGIRRIEAITADRAEAYVNDKLAQLKEVSELLKTQDVSKALHDLMQQHHDLKKEMEALGKEKAKSLKGDLLNKVKEVNGVNFLAEKVDLDPKAIKDVAYQIKDQVDNLFLVLGTDANGKANLTVAISENLVKEKEWNAGSIVKDLATAIQGGGGGQPFFATAGGKKPEGIEEALKNAEKYL